MELFYFFDLGLKSAQCDSIIRYSKTIIRRVNKLIRKSSYIWRRKFEIINEIRDISKLKKRDHINQKYRVLEDIQSIFEIYDYPRPKLVTSTFKGKYNNIYKNLSLATYFEET